MRILFPAAAFLFIASLQAATITYSPTEQTDGQTANVTVVFSDEAQPGVIVGAVAVDPDSNDPDVGDIRAIFFNFVNLPIGLTPEAILASISGPNITNTVLNSNTLGGQATVNPLPAFDVGLEFGTSGIGGDDIQFTTFIISHPDFTLANLGSVAVRVTSIGAPGSGREGSGKFFDDDGDFGGEDPGGVIPEPSTYALAGSALLFIAWARRKRS